MQHKQAYAGGSDRKQNVSFVFFSLKMWHSLGQACVNSLSSLYLAKSFRHQYRSTDHHPTRPSTVRALSCSYAPTAFLRVNILKYSAAVNAPFWLHDFVLLAQLDRAPDF